ncbi:MAG: hypothetical protein IKZ48_05865 [Prevotella sp.]|nr:hypothetical protein [Prevotella sp.]
MEVNSGNQKLIIMVTVGVVIIGVLFVLAQMRQSEQIVEKQGEGETEVQTDTIKNDSIGWSEEEAEDSLMVGISLNDIRFKDYEAKDWVDNEYIRTLRRYLDAFVGREIENKELEPYRQWLGGKFVIFDCEPCLGGGLYLRIVFYEHPDCLFNAWVYSDVDMKKEIVTGYHVQYISMGGIIDFTQEDIMEAINAHPENKFW